MRTESMSEQTMYDLVDMQDKELVQMVAEYQSGLPTQPWPVLPADAVKQIWLEFSNTGTTQNLQQLEEFRILVMRNISRLYVNTVIAGHTEMHPEHFLEDTGITDIDGFVSWAIDTEDGHWRISDYGLPKLMTIMGKLHTAATPGRKIMYIDAVLNVVHQRSDLAGLFIEGGIATLVELATD